MLSRTWQEKKLWHKQRLLGKTRESFGDFYQRREKPLTPEQSPEQQAEAKRLKAEATEAGEKLGWKPEHALKYAVALTRWIAAGRPIRTDEEVEEIVAICEDCDKYKTDEKRCRVCGCGVSTGGLAIFNKARLATERCPKDKW